MRQFQVLKNPEGKQIPSLLPQVQRKPLLKHFEPVSSVSSANFNTMFSWNLDSASEELSGTRKLQAVCSPRTSKSAKSQRGDKSLISQIPIQISADPGQRKGERAREERLYNNKNKNKNNNNCSWSLAVFWTGERV